MSEYYVMGLTVRVNGTPLVAAYGSLLERAVVDDHVFLPAMFALTFRDPDHDVLTGAALEIGATLTIEAASHGGTSTTLVEGEVNALEGEFTSAGSHAVVRGYDRSHRLHRGRKTRSWTQVKDSEVVSEIAGAAGVSVGRVDTTSVTHQHLVQPNMTDWEFLTLRSRELGYDLAYLNGRLEFRKPPSAGDGPAPGTLRRGGAPARPRPHPRDLPAAALGRAAGRGSRGKGLGPRYEEGRGRERLRRHERHEARPRAGRARRGVRSRTRTSRWSGA